MISIMLAEDDIMITAEYSQSSQKPLSVVEDSREDHSDLVSLDQQVTRGHNVIIDDSKQDKSENRESILLDPVTLEGSKSQESYPRRVKRKSAQLASTKFESQLRRPRDSEFNDAILVTKRKKKDTVDIKVEVKEEKENLTIPEAQKNVIFIDNNQIDNSVKMIKSERKCAKVASTKFWSQQQKVKAYEFGRRIFVKTNTMIVKKETIDEHSRNFTPKRKRAKMASKFEAQLQKANALEFGGRISIKKETVDKQNQKEEKEVGSSVSQSSRITVDHIENNGIDDFSNNQSKVCETISEKNEKMEEEGPRVQESNSIAADVIEIPIDKVIGENSVNSTTPKRKCAQVASSKFFVQQQKPKMFEFGSSILIVKKKMNESIHQNDYSNSGTMKSTINQKWKTMKKEPTVDKQDCVLESNRIDNSIRKCPKIASTKYWAPQQKAKATEFCGTIPEKKNNTTTNTINWEATISTMPIEQVISTPELDHFQPYDPLSAMAHLVKETPPWVLRRAILLVESCRYNNNNNNHATMQNNVTKTMMVPTFALQPNYLERLELNNQYIRQYLERQKKEKMKLKRKMK